MSESNKVAIRTRPRPYDLRRKVLLKNFLKEQMTYLPVTRRSSSAIEEETDLIDDSTISENDENLQSLDEEETTEQSTDSSKSDLASASQTVSINENCTPLPDLTNTDVKPIESRFSRFSNMIKRKIGQRKRGGVSKAKYTYKNLNKSMTPLSEKRKYFTSSTKRKKSILSMFRSKNNPNDNSVDSSNALPDSTIDKPSIETLNTATTSNQSVQTEISWSQEEYSNLEQSNKDLREENRLLSESLSTMISNTTFNLNPQKPYGTDSYTNGDPLPIQEINLPVKTLKIKPTTAKTFLYRTRSRSMYNSKHLVDTNPRLTSATSSFVNRRHSFTLNSPTTNNKSSVLKNLSINNTTRTIVRRASMPECERVRPLLRTRSNSIQQFNNQPKIPHKPQRLSFPHSIGHQKPLVRRTSMPERNGVRPFLRHRQSNCHEYASVQSRYRPKVGEHSRPFKNSQSEVLY